MASSSRVESTVLNLPTKFHPQKSFLFPKRRFGKKDERSFKAEWCEDGKYPWLHYNIASDSAFCHLCMTAVHQGKLLASTRRDPAFLSKGFTYWKEATTAFKKHQASQCHKEANEAINLLPKQVHDIGELLSQKHSDQKVENREVFIRILQNLRFLARQGLALRGTHGDEVQSNFMQLFNLQGEDCPLIKPWISKKTNNYLSHHIQNECLQIMALQIL